MEVIAVVILVLETFRIAGDTTYGQTVIDWGIMIFVNLEFIALLICDLTNVRRVRKYIHFMSYPSAKAIIYFFMSCYTLSYPTSDIYHTLFGAYFLVATVIMIGIALKKQSQMEDLSFDHNEQEHKDLSLYDSISDKDEPSKEISI